MYEFVFDVLPKIVAPIAVYVAWRYRARAVRAERAYEVNMSLLRTTRPTAETDWWWKMRFHSDEAMKMTPKEYETFRQFRYFHVNHGADVPPDAPSRLLRDERQ